MGIGIVKEEKIDDLCVPCLDILFNNHHNNIFHSPIRYTIPLSDFILCNEKFIYNTTGGLLFNQLHPEFQRIMKEEFLK